MLIIQLHCGVQIARLEGELSEARDESIKDEVQMLTAEVEHYKLMSNAESDSAKSAQLDAERRGIIFLPSLIVALSINPSKCLKWHIN